MRITEDVDSKRQGLGAVETRHVLHVQLDGKKSLTLGHRRCTEASTPIRGGGVTRLDLREAEIIH